jgi:hypothetical protein
MANRLGYGRQVAGCRKDSLQLLEQVGISEIFHRNSPWHLYGVRQHEAQTAATVAHETGHTLEYGCALWMTLFARETGR